VALKRQIARAKEQGWRVKTGVECEYFLLSKDGLSLADARDTQEKPCYDQSALMRHYPVITEICDAMLGLGWGAYQNDHEDANGQFEMNWAYDDALVTADRHVFFKYMVKTLAEKHGLRATFMPKPFRHLTGNGCHAHVSVWDTDGRRNLFQDDDAELGLSPLALNFLGGVVNGADELCAVFNPAVNSYKRINAPRTLSGATWAPNAVSWSGNNRTHMIRVPDAGRLELRLLDGATNPYLAQAAILVLGTDGMRRSLDPGPRLGCNMYTDGHAYTDLKRLPLNLLDAVRLFEGSQVARAGFGEELVRSYAKLKRDEWDRYCGVVTDWERETTLDC
jgi:glutamine synthetase